MAWMYVQAGSSLQKVSTSGTITTLTLPTDVSIDASVRGRFATLDKQVVFVNAGNINLWIDPATDTVRPMTLSPPSAAPNVAAGAAGNLTGDYKIKFSFGIKDDNGKLLSESVFSPESASVTLASDNLNATGIAISDQGDVNFRRVYRTAAGGFEFFRWTDIDGNIVTSVEDDLSDDSLSLIPIPDRLGVPPGSRPGSSRIELITEWKGRLWAKAVGRDAIVDRALFSEINKFYAWPAQNGIDIPPKGKDEFGITAIIPRKDVLGIARRGILHMITSPDPTETERRVVIEGVGCIAPESVVVIRDIAYFLGEDGVYEWGPEGIRNISKKDVHKWFTTSDEFQRASFPNARAQWNPVLDTYDLLLPATGQATLNRWVSWDRVREHWTGPHLTGAFTPNAVGLLKDANDIDIPVMASTSGFIHTMNDFGTLTDGPSTAIDYDWETVFDGANTPDIEKLFLQLSILSKIESAGTLTITPKVGGLDASAGAAISHDLTLGRERLRRLGQGRFVAIRARNNESNQPATVFGYELPYHEIGRR